jgi:hypothetical protein
MGVDIPQPFHSVLDGPVTVAGIPSTFHINIDNLPQLRLNVEHLPEIHLNIDHIPNIQLGVDPVEIRLTEFPSIRGHLPADFCVGLSVLGMELLTLRLCGEAQIITEPYRPNPCEVCGPTLQPAPQPQPQPQPVPVQGTPLSASRPPTAGERPT